MRGEDRRAESREKERTGEEREQWRGVDRRGGEEDDKLLISPFVL